MYQHIWFKGGLSHQTGFLASGPWQNLGFDQVDTQTLYRSFRTPDVGDLGIENIYTFVPPPPPPTPAWSETPSDRLRGQVRTLGFIQEIGFLVPQLWINFGFDQVTTQPLHRGFRTPEIGDTGIENTFTFVPPPVFKFIDWPAPSMYKQPKPWRAASFMLGDSGIENIFTFVPPPVQFFLGFEQVTTQPLHRSFRSPDIGDQGTENVFTPPFIAPITWGYDVQSTLFRVTPRGAGLFRGSDGIDARQQLQGVWGFDIQPALFKARPTPSAIFRGIDGIDRNFNWLNAGWEVQYSDVQFRPQNRGPAAIMRGLDGTDPPFSQWYNFGWEVQPPQPPAFASLHARMGAGFMLGDSGTEQIQINAPPPFGWLVQPWQPPSQAIITARAGAVMLGDSGIYNIYVFTPPPPPPAGIHLVGLIGVTAHVGRGGYDPDPNL
jgi:hypothetical protein